MINLNTVWHKAGFLFLKTWSMQMPKWMTKRFDWRWHYAILNS